MTNQNKAILAGVAIVIISAAVITYIRYLTPEEPTDVAPEVVVQAVRKTDATPPPTTPATSTLDTSGWKTFQNEKYGLEFKYPDYLEFNGSQVAMADEILYTASANYEKDGNNFFYFSVYDKVKGEKGIDEEIALGQNEHIKKELAIPNGKLIMTDGSGTMNYYFMDAYFKGSNYIYKFELSRPTSSPEMLELFQGIVSTANLTK